MLLRNEQPKPFIAILFLHILFLLAPFISASPITSPLQLPPASDFPEGAEITRSRSSHGNATIERRQMSEGSSCDDSEGQWNCLTNRWQRCAAGQWSAVMDCAAGTICTPSGLTTDFFVQFENGAAGPSTSDGTRRFEPGVMRWVFVSVLGGISVVHALTSS
ncbi:uncharacterized protein F4812DRAFT_437519 [Daldinia caldariorum]|uniref:uncharacterized protein n=1 Tax=Daldinia caldariorum TaxID=326644 RepID=UPI002007EDED|nr:uncharacterized protein F4812DRAFT_437519 [Daldinia caldariorum]KAI1465771.1 hypothetical protein F4812DRAFT_437519 [Daldinia caldariorum]